MVRSIGTALGRKRAAERIALAIESREAHVRGQTDGIRPVRFAYLIWRKPWMSVNSDTYPHSLLAVAGGINVFGDRPDRYPAVTSDDLREADAGVLLLGSEPFPFSERHVDELAEVTGMERARIRLIDGEYISWHGSRTPAGIAYAFEIIAAAREELVERRR